MKTRKEYKDYYLDKLIRMFPGLTQADYNSAQEFCYNEEWDLKDTDSVEGLNDAWKEYEKRFDEGFEVMNNRQVKSGYERNAETLRQIYSMKIPNIKNIFTNPMKQINKKNVPDKNIETQNTDKINVKEYSESLEQISKIETEILYNNIIQPEPPISLGTLKLVYDNVLRKYLRDESEEILDKNELKKEISSFDTQLTPVQISAIITAFLKCRKKYSENGDEYFYLAVESSRRNNMIKSSNEITRGLLMTEGGETLNLYEMDGYIRYQRGFDFPVNWKTTHCGFAHVCRELGWRKAEQDDEDGLLVRGDTPELKERHNAIRKLIGNSRQIKSSKETLYEDDCGSFYTWSELKADIDDFVKTSDFKDQFEGDEDMFEYFEKDHKTPKYYKIYMDFWDISSNGAMSEVEGTEEQWNEYNEQHGITSAKENNMKTPIKSGYTGTNVSVEYGPYGEEKEFPLYDITGETVEQIDETIGYYDEKGAHWGTDGNSYVILEDRAYSEDKIAVQEDDYNDWVEAMNNEDYSKVIKSSRNIKSSYNVENDIYAVYVDDDLVEFVANTNIPGYEYISMNEYGDIAYHDSFRPDWFDKFKKKWGTVSDVEEQSNVRMYGPKVLDAIEKSLEYDKYEKDMKENGTMYEWKDYEGNWNPVDPDTSTMAMCRTNNIPVRPIKSSKENNMKKNINSSRNMEAVSVAENMPGVQKTYDKGSEILVYLENGTDNNAAEKLLKQIMDTLEDEYDNYGFKGNIENHGGKYYIVLEPELTSGCHGKNKDKKKKPVKSAKNRYGWDPDDGMPVVEWANSKWFAFIPDKKYFEEECKKRGITTIKNSDEFFNIVKEMGGIRGDAEGHFFTFPETGMVKSSRQIKSGRFIKSGTSNFVSNDGDFPLCVYIAENYVYDEESDTETEERDYDADQWEYDDAVDNAKSLAEEMDIYLSEGSYRRGLNGGDDYGSPYIIGITSGYYEGIQIQIEDNGSFDPEYMTRDDYDYNHDDSFDDLPQEEQDRMISETEDKLINEQTEKINAYLEKLRKEYGWIWLGVSARFSNGETWYTKIDNSRKSIKSSVDNDSTMGERAGELGITFDNVLDVFTGYGYGKDEAEDFWNSTFDEIPYETWNDFSELADMFGIEDDKSSVNLEEAVYDGLAEASPHTQDVAIKWFKDEIDLNDFETTDELAEYIRYMAEDFADANPGIRKDLEDCGLIEPEEDEEIESSRKPVRSGKELNGKQKDDFIKKAMKKQGYSSSEADTMINQSRR